MDLTFFERYRDIIADWDAFAAIQTQPPRPTIWTNTLRLEPAEITAYLESDGFELEPIPWYHGGFRLSAGSMPGKSLARLLGLFHIQEEVSMIPVHFLDPQPGERLIDLCAAPGNKTVQAAVRMQNRGTVIANDIHPHRIGLIYQSLERIGVTCGAVLHSDAGNLPRGVGLYDRVLADVPCSCEGTLRKNPEILNRGFFPGRRQTVQIAILRKAFKVCRPGGRIVYATCTYAPEENEEVVDAILRERGDSLRLLPARIPGFKSAPGLSEWQGQSFHPSMPNAMRIYPHQNDSGGFFIAVFEKSDDGADEIKPPANAGVKDPIDPTDFLEQMEARFGIPKSELDGEVVFRSSSKRTSLASTTLEIPIHPKPWSVGVPCYSTRMKHYRMASSMARKIGHAAKRNLVDLEPEQVDRLIADKEIRLTPDQAAACEGDGYVLPRHRGFVLTIAHFRADDDGGMIRGSIPKQWIHALGSGSFFDEE